MMVDELIPIARVPELTGMSMGVVETAIDQGVLRVIRPSGSEKGRRYVTMELIREWLQPRDES